MSKPADAAVDALARSSILHDFSHAELVRLLEYTEPVEVVAQAPLVREGEGSRDMFFVIDGEARAFRGRLTLHHLGPGGHFGSLALLSGRPRAASVTAVTPLTLAKLSLENWTRFVSEESGLALRVIKAVFSQVREDLVDMTDSVGALLQGRSLPRAEQVTVFRGGRAEMVKTGTTVRSLLPPEVDGDLVVAGLLGQKPVSLDTAVVFDSVVAPLTISHWEGRQIWTRSVGLLLLEAAHQVEPELDVRLGPARGAMQIVEIRGAARLDREAFARRVAETMADIARAAAPVRQEYWTVEEAMAHFHDRGWESAAKLLRTHRHATVSLVSCGEVYSLGLSPMMPDTGSLTGFSLLPHDEGLLLDFGPRDPRRSGPNGTAPPPRDAGMVAEHRRWLAAMGITSVGAFNDLCISGQVSQVIRVAEGFHEKQIGKLADDIAAAREQVRVIAIAGPSSSGKTTFIKRLTVQLQINGLNPLGVSLDDYYVDREKTVRDGKGNYDFEALEALDLELLWAHLRCLLAGEQVTLARYDFKTGKSQRDGGATLRMGPSDVLMLEGIHGLNPKLLGDIPRPGQVYRVFIHPTTTLPFDRLSRVSATDIRVLRRIVRDRRHRGYSAADNIVRFPSVQAGERRHIFPYQPEADVVFDSSLIYEPAVLKVYAERYLLETPTNHPAYATAFRLRHVVDRFVSIYPEHVPPTSIIREFIGGSAFEY